MRPRGLERHVPARSEAFSLIELMIALVIIGIMVMTVAPSLQQVLGDQRQTSAAGELVRIGRRARAASIESGAAHLLRFDASEPAESELGRIELYVGMNSKCLQTDWEQAMDMGDQPIAVFDMTEFNPTDGSTQPEASDSGRQVITLRAQTINGNTATDRSIIFICFQPNGDVYVTPADDSDADELVMQRDRVRFSIARTIDGVSYGTVRRVLFPAAGSMRFE
jgi:prepilin-type N-terminal cleavage/methylation domain-containing protein